MNCATQLAGILWSIDAWLLCWIIVAVAAPFAVWGAAAWYYRTRYAEGIELDRQFNNLHGR